jgi:prepilin-type N-terminal cleavage/methylation domain-containing protein
MRDRTDPGLQRGLTLIEIIIALALSAIVVGIIGSLFVASLNTWRRGSDLREAQAMASIVTDTMARDIRNASQAPSVTLNPHVVVDEGEPLLSIADARPVEPNSESVWILYVRVPERHEVRRQAVVPAADGRVTTRDDRLVATGVERVEIQQVANGVTIEVQVRRGREVATSRTTAAPRNP